MFKKIIAYILVFATVISFAVVPSFAAAAGYENLIIDSGSLSAWDDWLDRNIVVKDFGLIDCKAACWTVIDRCFSSSGCGSVSSVEKLLEGANLWNKRIASPGNWGSLAVYCVIQGFDSSVPTAEVAYDSSLGVYRLREYWSGLWLVNSSGHFPYYRPDSADDTTGTEKIRTGQWVEMSKVGTQTVLWHVVSNYELNEFKDQWSDVYPNIRLQETDNYFWLTVTVGARPLVLCDKYGYPYYLPKDGKTAVSTPNNYYQDTTNQYIDDSTTNNYYDYENNEYNEYDNSTNVNVMDGGSALVGSPIDVNNGIINVGGELQYIDNLVYDASTQTYYVDAHDEYTYNATINNYVTNVYHYSIEYHINYTSITYIGQTEEYDKRYEMYYQLPDGRSSADLTAEDLEQLSTVFTDVVQYARAADDLNQRVLYHFDGNTEDSSYFSYRTSFNWTDGASITYMDEGTFGGSLYLDETFHRFEIELPYATDITGDFTLQFRYYQSYTATPANDSSLWFGSTLFMYFSGDSFYALDGVTKIAQTPIGTWNEICIMRKGNITYYYLNGDIVWITNVYTRYYIPRIIFRFGSEQQTYKKIDELRFTNAAIYTPGENYTPTAVPYDSNLTLVLPDGETAIGDEVPVVVPGKDNLLADIGLDDWSDYDSVAANIDPAIHTTLRYTYQNNNKLWIHGNGFQLTDLGNSTKLSFAGDFTVQRTSGISPYDIVYNTLFLPCKFEYAYPSWVTSGSTQYCLSVVLSDGSFCYVIFTPDGSVATVYGDTFMIFKYQQNLYRYDAATSSAYYTSGLVFYPAVDDVEIVYMELVKGSKPAFTIEYEQAVYTSGELENSPLLAVRTNRPITGYQIGGVRPSYPTKGLVYAMVENSRIRSLQQYTGSAWEEVDGRIWTGERWIPYSSFDVFTLQDFYDIIGGSDDDYEYIYTESGFWTWWQKQWKEFTGTLFDLLERILSAGGGDSGISIEDNTLIDDDDKLPFDEKSYKGIIKTMRRSLDFLFGFFDSVSGGLNDFLDQFDNTNSVFFGLFNLSGLGG